MSKNYYNRTNACDICGKRLPPAIREMNNEGNWTGRWLCQNCWQRYDPNSGNNIQKSLRDHRTGNLKPNCSSAKGDLFEELTCKWRSTVSTIPVENLNKKLDNYRSPIDHSRDSELGIIQTKGSTYNKIEKKWTFSELVLDHKKIFDNTICYCASENMKYIERIYIFIREEIIKRTGIAIYKVRHSSRYPWYEEYRVDDETVKYVNEIFKDLRCQHKM